MFCAFRGGQRDGVGPELWAGAPRMPAGAALCKCQGQGSGRARRGPQGPLRHWGQQHRVLSSVLQGFKLKPTI